MIGENQIILPVILFKQLKKFCSALKSAPEERPVCNKPNG
jgi:hypothetical protein